MIYIYYQILIYNIYISYIKIYNIIYIIYTIKHILHIVYIWSIFMKPNILKGMDDCISIWCEQKALPTLE